MADKKKVMGRNLGALLGGATRNRQAKSTPAVEQATSQADVASLTKTGPVGTDRHAEKAQPAGGGAATTRLHSNNTAPTGKVKPDNATAGSLTPSNVTPHPSSSAAANESAAHNLSAPNTLKTPLTDAEKSPSTVANSVGTTAEPEVTAQSTDKLRMLGVDQIKRGEYQPRRHFDQELLQELADSLGSQGMIQPILVRPVAGAFEIIAGERRWRAAQLAGITEVPVIVRELDDQSVAAVSLIENIQRADLNPLEEAEALQRLCDEFSMTHQAVAESVGRSRAAVTNLMRLLELDDKVKSFVDKGEIDMGHARALLGAPLSEQLDIAQRIVKQGLTVRAVEKLVRDLREGKPLPTGKANPVDPNIEALRRKLVDILGAPVNIRHQKSGSGKIEIAYTSADELEGILKHIK